MKARGSENRVGWLPRKRITHIPSNVAEAQRQILDLFNHALNIDGGNEPLAERMVSYYRLFDTVQCPDAPREPFHFERQSVRFEAVDSKTFTDVLYPISIYDLISFHLSECVKRETRLRACKNCGRYFAI